MGEVIEFACYYTIDNDIENDVHCAQIYDCDGHIIKMIELEKEEYNAVTSVRIDKMMDPNALFKPAKIVLTYSYRTGRILNFEDKRGKVVFSQKYNHYHTTLTDFCNYMEKQTDKLKINYKWILLNGVNVKDESRRPYFCWIL